MKKILSLLLAAVLLCGCSATPPTTIQPEPTVAPPTQPITEPPTTAPPETTEAEPEWETLRTSESTCFTVISYCCATQELQLQFRESGSWYSYFNVEPRIWDTFKNSDSKGGFYNDFIKGRYEYERLN